MALFGSDPALIALAQEVGALREQVRSLKEQVERTDTERHAVGPVVTTAALSPKMDATIRALAGKDTQLHQHLAEEARTHLAFGAEEATVIQALVSGSGRPQRT